MKSIILSIASLLIVSSASAEVITATKKWSTVNQNYEWSPLEMLGVRKSAEDEGVNQCHQQGFDDCRILSSAITRCNTLEWEFGVFSSICEARATIRGSYLDDSEQ